MVDPAPPEFVLLLGERVRSLRRRAGLTVQQLADRSGVSRRMLTQIELGQANPSLVTVDKVARALGAGFAGLVLPDPGEPLTVYPAGSARTVWSSPRGSRALLHVATSGSGGPELWTWTLVPGDRYAAEPDPPGSEELFLVRSGTLTLLAEGCEPAHLGEGSAARLATDRDYSYLNDGSEPVVFDRVVDVRAAEVRAVDARPVVDLRAADVRSAARLSSPPLPGAPT